MALMECPECGKIISDKAVTCPECGFPVTNPPPQNKSTGTTKPPAAKTSNGIPADTKGTPAGGTPAKPFFKNYPVLLLMLVIFIVIIYLIAKISSSSGGSGKDDRVTEEAATESQKIITLVDDYLDRKISFEDAHSQIASHAQSIKDIAEQTKSEKDAKTVRFSAEVRDTLFDLDNYTKEKINALLSSRNSLGAMIGVRGKLLEELSFATT